MKDSNLEMLKQMGITMTGGASMTITPGVRIGRAEDDTTISVSQPVTIKSEKGNEAE